MGEDGHRLPQPEPSGPGGAWTIISYLISRTAVWGGVGWLLSRWLDVFALLPIGLAVGIVAALYLSCIRYGR